MAKKLTQNVNKDQLFNDLPKVNPQKSKWLTRWTNYQSCNLGQIVPIYYDEVLPNEKRKVTMSMISHTVTPKAPIFNSMYTELRAFFVPIRLCADLLNGYKTRKSPWVKVFGEDNANTNSNIIVPLSQQTLPSFTTGHRFISDVNTYMSNGTIPKDNVFDSLDMSDPNADGTSYYAKLNYLQLAAYELIYQRHYRNENFESATGSVLYRLLFDAYNSSKASVTIPLTFSFEVANREKDYFTGVKPFTLKAASPVTVGLAGTAPVGAKNTTVASISSRQVALTQASTPVGAFGQGSMTYSSGGSSTSFPLIADLSSASGITIEELRLLIKTQELLEKDAMYGSLYAESLNAHFGCCPLDLTLQDPQELYKTTITSNMQAIFQTSSTSGEASILGTIGANSTTQTDPFVILPETEFKEHGILMICAVHKLQNVYDAGWFKPKFIYKKARFDFYTPELNDLGYQPVTDGEFTASSNPIFGYNEAFAEYRFKFNKSHGNLVYNFEYWAPSIADDYNTAAAMYKEDTDVLDRALSVTHSAAPQFYDAWGFLEENEKPMSLHSIPGMDGVI